MKKQTKKKAGSSLPTKRSGKKRSTPKTDSPLATQPDGVDRDECDDFDELDNSDDYFESIGSDGSPHSSEKTKRLSRLLEIIGLLQTSQADTPTLARELSVSRRTVHRDIRLLQEAGIPIEYDPDLKSYCLSGKMLLPPTNFSTEEALTLLALCTDIGRDSQIPFFEPARSAAMKLIANLPAKLTDRVHAMNDVLKIQMHRTNPLTESRSTFDRLVEAYRKRHSVRIWYKSPAEDDEVVTVVQPYQLMFCVRSWYVIGRSSLHREPRTFHIGRIRKMETLKSTYHVPAGWTLSRYLRNAWRLIPESGPDSHVVVRFNKLVAQNVAEIQWHETQRIVENRDGSIDYHVDVSGLNEISWHILGYGRNAEVLRPKKLRRIIAGHIKDMAQNYQNELAALAVRVSDR